jgi:PmbA protein
VDQAIERCLAQGFDAAQVRVADQQLHELQADFGKPALLRTVRDADVALTGLIDGKKGSLSFNRKDEASLAEAVSELWDLATGSLADEANVIADRQPPQSFEFGPAEPDYDTMFASLNDFLTYTRSTYPLITLGSASLSFSGQAQAFGNSNGLQMDCVSAHYSGSAMFTARDGADVSSFNHSGFSAADLALPFQQRATTDETLRQTSEQVRTRKVPEQFTGSLIITPDALSDFIGFLLGNIGNGPLIAGTSLYRDKLGEPVAATGLTIRSCPLTLPAGYRFTADGLPVADTVIVDNGILKSYLLNLYGSKKTGLPLSSTAGGCLVVDPGDTDLADMIASTGQGVLITRFSGGVPNDRGDFSGVAKNSYYVADGEIRYPISETMISGNLAELLRNVDAISSERADFGWSRFPWIRAQGVGVS